MSSRHSRFATAFALAALVAAPSFAARGTADFTRYFAIGDSYGAGFESASLNQNHQQYSYEADIAKQVGMSLCAATATATDKCFAQPLVSYPGIGPENVLTDLSVVGGSIVPTITPAAGLGSPLMTTFGRPYNNLSVPGARVVDVTTITGKETPPPNLPLPVYTFAPFILRGLGTEVDQVLSQNPTFITIWIGGNDVLLSALNGTTKLITPPATFAAAYNAMLDKLVAGAPNAGIVVGTLPTAEVGALLPNYNLIPPIVTDATGKPVIVNGGTIPLVGDLGNGTVGALPAGTKVLLSAKAHLAQGYGYPGIPPFNALPHAGEPLPDSDTITPAEMAALQSAITDYNSAIQAAAASHNVAVADISGLFNRVFNGQEWIGPFNINQSFLTGGFFSLDGFHLTDIGYSLFANEYIKTINASYGKHIPLVPLTNFFSNNGAFFPHSSNGTTMYPGMAWDFSTASAQQLRQMWGVTEAPMQTRFRATHH